MLERKTLVYEYTLEHCCSLLSLLYNCFDYDSASLRIMSPHNKVKLVLPRVLHILGLGNNSPMNNIGLKCFNISIMEECSAAYLIENDFQIQRMMCHSVPCLCLQC